MQQSTEYRQSKHLLPQNDEHRKHQNNSPVLDIFFSNGLRNEMLYVDYVNKKRNTNL